MKPFIQNLDNSLGVPLYIQLYKHIKGEILGGDLAVGSKLPSLREIASESGLSVTTTNLAYEQLLTEGYIVSKPKSGYFVAEIPTTAVSSSTKASGKNPEIDDYTFERGKYLHDPDSFDFGKWKKCSARVLTEYKDMLLFESDVQGEAALRFEICKYLYSSRGVSASPEQVVIGAGSQQLTSHLARILTLMGIDLVCTEDPGYIPIQNVFRDRGFSIAKIPVTENGIRIDRLPSNLPTAVYVSPANQFPTGSVMPIGARYKLLEWAAANKSIILEDDYDSELRYFGKPVPALQGLDEAHSVVYLGSFSSTLFPAIKISYMILPPHMAEIFDTIKKDYTQTCSKSEQLTLALFMEDGYYYTNIRKLRSLYAQKLQLALAAFEKYASAGKPAQATASGWNADPKHRANSVQGADPKQNAISEREASSGNSADPKHGANSVQGADSKHRANSVQGAGHAASVTATNTKSGISMTLSVRTQKPADELCRLGESLGLHLVPLNYTSSETQRTSEDMQAISSANGTASNRGSDAANDAASAVDVSTANDAATQQLIFYFNQIPLDKIDASIRDLIRAWNA